MSDHLPECNSRNEDYGIEYVCLCHELRACEERILRVVILKAELTFRSDIINPVRDIVEPLMNENNNALIGTETHSSVTTHKRNINTDNAK